MVRGSAELSIPCGRCLHLFDRLNWKCRLPVGHTICYQTLLAKCYCLNKCLQNYFLCIVVFINEPFVLQLVPNYFYCLTLFKELVISNTYFRVRNLMSPLASTFTGLVWILLVFIELSIISRVSPFFSFLLLNLFTLFQILFQWGKQSFRRGNQSSQPRFTRNS